MTGSRYAAEVADPPAAGRPAVAVLIKQVPSVAETPVRADGRLARDAVGEEMNPHCRRALAKGIELAKRLGGTCTVLTLGPPRAEKVLIEALGCGADRAVLISDPRLAGADTLATARALAAALALTGRYDLVLTGRNSVDSDTGQVSPQVAELAGMAFVGPAREIHVHGSVIAVRSELDDGWRESEAYLPAVVSCAERLCPPAKLPDPPEQNRLRGRIRHLTAADLGPGPWGQAGSPTFVERVETVTQIRCPEVAHGISGRHLDRLIALITESAKSAVPVREDPVADSVVAAVPAEPGTGSPGGVIAVLAEPGRPSLTRELLGGAADLARTAGAPVVVIICAGDLTAGQAGMWGADEAVVADGGVPEAALATAVASWCGWRRPAAVLAPGSSWGREVAGRISARIGAGLTGDAIGVRWERGALTCLKAVSGGNQTAVIRYTSPVQMATVRPGVFPLRLPRAEAHIPELRLMAASADRVFHFEQAVDADVDALGAARVVIGVGSGVAAGDYPLVHRLRDALGAQLVATRRVTDAGLLPQYRQVGITGRSIAPSVYLALGVSGKPNHMIGVRRASFIAAVNTDPAAPVFSVADLGFVADWRDFARALMSRIGVQAPGDIAGDGRVLADRVPHAR